MQLVRYSAGLQVFVLALARSLPSIAMLLFFVCIGLCIFSSAIYFAESAINTPGFGSIPGAPLGARWGGCASFGF